MKQTAFGLGVTILGLLQEIASRAGRELCRVQNPVFRIRWPILAAFAVTLLFAVGCKKNEGQISQGAQSGVAERPKIEGWGGVRWGDPVETVKTHYPKHKEDIQNSAAWEHTIEIENVEVPGLAFASAMFDFRSGKLAAVFINGSLSGDIAAPLLRKYGYAQRREKHPRPMVGEEMIMSWWDAAGNSLRLRMFPDSGSVYLGYYSAASEVRRAQAEAAANAREDRGI